MDMKNICNGFKCVFLTEGRNAICSKNNSKCTMRYKGHGNCKYFSTCKCCINLKCLNPSQEANADESKKSVTEDAQIKMLKIEQETKTSNANATNKVIDITKQIRHNSTNHEHSKDCKASELNTKYYAVKKGRTPGIYSTWEECKEQVNRYPGAQYKKFNFLTEAEEFMNTKEEKGDTSDLPYAYVDGSYLNGVYGYGGFVVDKNGMHELKGNGSDPDMAAHRNVAGEILGAMAAIQYAVEHGIKKLLIYYDYTGIENWANGTWRANKRATQMYQEYCMNCGIELVFQHVKGHTGVAGNEVADRLAKEAVGAI